MVLAGCVEPKILERISLTTLVGYDLAENNQLTSTAVIRQINPDLESKIEVQSATATTSKWTRAKIDLKTSKRIVAGQLRVVLFGEDLAKEGLGESIHTLKMNAEVSNAIYLAIVEGESKSLLEHNYENITEIGQHVFQLIQQNIEQQHAISSTLHEINRDNLSDLESYAMPLLKKEGDLIEISGIALFSKGKMVGKLSAEDSFFVMLIRDNTHNGSLELVLPGETIEHASSDFSEELPIAVDSIKSKRNITLVDQSVPEFDLTIDFDCRLLEINSSVSVDESSIIKKIEKEMNQKIEREISRVIQYSQDHNSDIFRFGDHYKAQVRNTNVDGEKWHEMYPEMKVNVTVNAKIIRSSVFH